MILGHGQRRKRKKKALLSISGVAELAASALVLLLLAALLLLLSSSSSEEKEAATEAEASPFFIDRGRGGTLDDERRRGTNFFFNSHYTPGRATFALHVISVLLCRRHFNFAKELTFFSLSLQSSPPFSARDRIREALASGPHLPPRPPLLRPAPVPSGATRGFTSDSPADTGTEGGGGEEEEERSNRKLTSGGQDRTGGHRCKKQTLGSEKSYAINLLFFSSEA